MTTKRTDWKEDEAARLGAEIRRTMARIGGADAPREGTARVGRLVDQRIEAAYERGLRAALAQKPGKSGASSR